MDFGVLGLDGFVGPDSNAGAPFHHVSAPAVSHKILGSSFGKQERSSGSGQDVWRTSKMLKTDGSSGSNTAPLHHQASLLRSTFMVFPDTCHQENMLSFSSAQTEVTAPFLSKDSGLLERNSQNHTVLDNQYSPSGNTTSAGYGSERQSANMQGTLIGFRGPFTASQLVELEHQALIYKYITANVAVPSNLLIPLKKSLYSFGFSGFSAGSYSHNSLGWGGFRLAYPGNSTDPEPGRCRRTDGKKWRCSRDAVADQKYCERHINRSRHRSRKPVEGQTGHATTGTTNSKVGPMTTSGVFNSLAITQQQFKNLQPLATSSSTDALVNRAQDQRVVPRMSSTNLKSVESIFPIPKQAVPINNSLQTEFGVITCDSLRSSSQRTCLSSKNSASYLKFSDQQMQDQHRFCQFIDDNCLKDPSSRSVISWPEHIKSDLTELGMSMPIASTELSSLSTSRTQEKHALSPLRLSCEYDPIQMGLGVGSDPNESKQKQANWIPISWATSLGGPLGEALSNICDKAGSCKNSSALNLLTEGWDRSPQMGSSPTGVLQKSSFGWLSNSSSNSSPRAEGNQNTVPDDLPASTIVSSSSPASSL